MDQDAIREDLCNMKVQTCKGSWLGLHRVFFILGAVGFLAANAGLVVESREAWAVPDEGPGVAFRWAFGALVGRGADEKLMAVTQDTVLETGDELKMMVELQRQCYVYVIYHGARNEVKLLFPHELKQFSTDYAVGKRYYVPDGDGWFELDAGVGREAFHLLASRERLKTLEGLLLGYESAAPENRAEVAKEIVAEIRRLKKQHRELAVPAERPVTIGGRIRGMEKPPDAARPDVATIADEIHGADFYGRTFTIDHR
jgi:hypothetical protein